MGLLFAVTGVVLAIIAAATRYWVKLTKTTGLGEQHITMGLFETCVKGITTTCQSTLRDDDSSNVICDDHTVGEYNARIRAMQALLIAAIALGGVVVLLGAIRLCVSGRSPRGVEMVLAFFASICATITFAIYANLYHSWYACGQSICESECSTALTCACGLNYSFSLCVACIPFFLFGACLFSEPETDAVVVVVHHHHPNEQHTHAPHANADHHP